MEIAISIRETLLQFWDTNSGEFISALAGAFFGAWAAYWLQRGSENKKEIDQRHEAILEAQLALVTQLNTLQNIQKQHLDAFRNVPGRERKMAMFYQAASTLEVDFRALAFLLGTKHANFVAELHVVDRCFKTAIDALEVRNTAHRRLGERSKVVEGNLATGEFTIEADGRDLKLLLDTTDSLFSSVDDAERKCSRAIRDLKAVGKDLFPKRKFLQQVETTQNP